MNLHILLWITEKKSFSSTVNLKIQIYNWMSMLQGQIKHIYFYFDQKCQMSWQNYSQPTNQWTDESLFLFYDAHQPALKPRFCSGTFCCCSYQFLWHLANMVVWENRLIYADQMLQNQVSKMAMSARLNLWVVGAACSCQKVQIVMISLICMFLSSLLCTSDFFISWSMW